MIHTTALSKTFDKKIAVDNLNLTIDRGEIFGLLGPNASGKSTTIRMLCGLIPPTSGSIVIAGKDIAHSANSKQRIGYVSQYFGLYAELSVVQNVLFYAQLYGVMVSDTINTLLQTYGLEEFRNTAAGALSGGYKRKLSLVCALVHNPDILFLDEPTAGIDPVSRKELWDMFFVLAQQGKTLFVTTHYMEEAMRCHRVAFLNHGKLLACDSPAQLIYALGEVRCYGLEGGFDTHLVQELKQYPHIVLLNQFGTLLKIIVDSAMSKEQLIALLQPLMTQPVVLSDVAIDLEDVFIAMTQGEK